METTQQPSCACKAHEERVAVENEVLLILKNHRADKSDLIPVLQQVQQKLGYLPEPVLQQIARYTGVPESTVFGVATFYAQFKLVPSGRNIVRVCRGTACHVRGATRILKEVEKRLGVKPGESTPDLEYSFETVACIGACALAPNITVNNTTYGQVTAKKVAEIVERYRGESKDGDGQKG